MSAIQGGSLGVPGSSSSSSNGPSLEVNDSEFMLGLGGLPPEPRIKITVCRGDMMDSSSPHVLGSVEVYGGNLQDFSDPPPPDQVLSIHSHATPSEQVPTDINSAADPGENKEPSYLRISTH